MIITKKIQAGALQFVLFIGAVVAVLLASFMLLSFTHTHFDKKTDVLISVIKSADFGLESSLKKEIPLGGSIEISNENDLNIGITVQRDLWGVFEKRTVTTSHGNSKYVKTALIGGKDEVEMPALYVNDKQRPVIMAGNAKITGDAFLPAQGMKMGNIMGLMYNRSSLLYGRQRKSDSLLPKLSRELESQITKLTRYDFRPEGEIIDNIPKEGIKNSFQSPTLIIKDRVIRLKNTNLIGNIIVSASYKIIVEADANLQDVILLAPEISIENWVKGQFQAIATKSITVGKKCELAYPSVLVVNKKAALNNSENNSSSGTLNTQPAIYMDSYSWVGGIVMALDASTKQQYAPLIKIDPDAKVVGEVYCNKNLELKGVVTGNVSTDGFIALEEGSVYQNHLYNGQINSKNLDTSYAGLLLESREQNKKVMKWLY
ncbi:hypothetical protein FEE95_20965 [Maribacter algarum]|uniref:Uncharacterized protein n=1 Tax=Maribacter algarum (ex Zhang et al. 2020) TaxID=2578118 RepID=A0A5S3PDW1_9FLAO|nr:hypothetical protein [Maribacter algarum]TMM52162.1 hypothetical protein FEE95_20965 [Maribacter algarum]